MTLAQQQDTLLSILNEELKREISELKKAPVPPYYMDYQVNDVEYLSVSSSFGSLVSSSLDRSRVLKVNVRLGDYQFDNTHGTELANFPDYESLDLGAMGGYKIFTLYDKVDSVKYKLLQGAQTE
jgi:TldD protein